MKEIMTLIEFLSQYQESQAELEECQERLVELYYPQRGNQMIRGEHAGISNQPEEYAIIRDKLERKIAYLKLKIKKDRKKIDAFLYRLHPRTAKLLRKKYIEGHTNTELAAWMHMQDKSVSAALKKALEKAQPEYDKFVQHKKNEV
jgi:DNA-directed RNA polymerase specialized sigma24 family protein